MSTTLPKMLSLDASDEYLFSKGFSRSRQGPKARVHEQQKSRSIEEQRTQFIQHGKHVHQIIIKDEENHVIR